MNSLVKKLSEICSKQLLKEKWLVAPSLRIGHQWTDCVTRQGQPTINVRVKTLRNCAMNLAAFEMTEKNLRLISRLEGTLIISRILHRLKNSPSTYLFSLERSLSFSSYIYNTILDLRFADVTPKQIPIKHFEVPAK